MIDSTTSCLTDCSSNSYSACLPTHLCLPLCFHWQIGHFVYDITTHHSPHGWPQLARCSKSTYTVKCCYVKKKGVSLIRSFVCVQSALTFLLYFFSNPFYPNVLIWPCGFEISLCSCACLNSSWKRKRVSVLTWFFYFSVFSKLFMIKTSFGKKKNFQCLSRKTIVDFC